MEQRLVWISKAKEMLSKQGLAVQKIRDKETLKEWRRDKRSFNKSMNRATKRTEEDVPFAIDLNDLSLVSRQEMKVQTAKRTKREKCGLISSLNIDDKIRESFETLNQLETTRVLETLTPRSEQKLLQAQIKKISDLQNQIEDLKRSNEMIVQASFEEPHVLPVSSEGYQPTPSIIL